MPPSKKKPAVKGPFFFFMLEFREREKAKGKSFPGGMDQVMREAGPHWNKLTDQEREVYKDRAKEYKATPKQNYGEKYTSQGIAFSDIEKEQQERFKKQDTIRKAIAEMIQTAICENALEKMKVHLIAFNYFCKTTKDVFVPAEMAVIQYNLEMGVLEELHELINPGKLPLGLAYESSLLSEETHQLPVPPDAMGESDFEALLDKLLAFTDYNNKPFKMLTLLTDTKEVPIVESILSQLMDESKLTYQFLVCPLGEFFFQLKRATESYGLDICTFPAKTVADILLKKDTYEYTSGIACDFHEKLGNPKYCALSRVIRWSYIISDSCCLDLSIDMIAGRHLPLNADTTLCSYMSKTSDGLSFVSSSELTHVSLPKVQKVRSKSPFGGSEDGNSSVIYSSRSGIKKEKIDKNRTTSTVATNPFHNVDIQKSAEPEKLLQESKNAYNPFSRKLKMEEVRQPRGIEVVGHGRGALLGNMAGSGGSGSSSFFKGAGRGAGFFNVLFSAGESTSSVNSFQENGN